MFIAFYILILNIITTFSANGFIRIENDAPIEPNNDYQEVPIKEEENNRDMTKVSSNNWKYFQQNSSSNLNVNIFDKMLSDEMLSLKEQFHKKDATYSSGVQITTKSSLRTRTLDVKQRWLDLTSNFRDAMDDYSPKTNYNSNDKYLDMEMLPVNKIDNSANIKLQKTNSKKKILGLRSLEDNPHILHVSSGPTKKICTCFKGNPQSTCHKPGASTKTTGGHHNGDHSCTRTSCTDSKTENKGIPKFSVSAVYVTAAPYFVENMPEGNPFYPPAVIIGMTVTSPPSNDESKEETDSGGNLYYEDDKKYEDTDNNNFNKLQQLSEADDKLVEDIANDLNRQYHTASVKKCRCSATITKVTKIFLLILIYVIKLISY